MNKKRYSVPRRNGINANISQIPLCDVCEENAATLYCRQDSARLCTMCDEEVHSANKLVSKHMRVPVYEQPQSYGTCPVHPQLTVEFFCPICQGPVCVHCKVLSRLFYAQGPSNSSLDGGKSLNRRSSFSQTNSDRRCLPYIFTSFRKGTLELRHGGAEWARTRCRLIHIQDDPLLDGRRQSVMTQLSIIDERLKEVNRNSGEIEERIYQLLREALFQLQTETQRKVSYKLNELVLTSYSWGFCWVMNSSYGDS